MKFALLLVACLAMVGCEGINMHYRNARPDESVGFDGDSTHMTSAPAACPHNCAD